MTRLVPNLKCRSIDVKIGRFLPSSSRVLSILLIVAQTLGPFAPARAQLLPQDLLNASLLKPQSPQCRADGGEGADVSSETELSRMNQGIKESKLDLFNNLENGDINFPFWFPNLCEKPASNQGNSSKTAKVYGDQAQGGGLNDSSDSSNKEKKYNTDHRFTMNLRFADQGSKIISQNSDTGLNDYSPPRVWLASGGQVTDPASVKKKKKNKTLTPEQKNFPSLLVDTGGEETINWWRRYRIRTDKYGDDNASRPIQIEQPGSLQNLKTFVGYSGKTGLIVQNNDGYLSSLRAYRSLNPSVGSEVFKEIPVKGWSSDATSSITTRNLGMDTQFSNLRYDFSLNSRDESFRKPIMQFGNGSGDFDLSSDVQTMSKLALFSVSTEPKKRAKKLIATSSLEEFGNASMDGYADASWIPFKNGLVGLEKVRTSNDGTTPRYLRLTYHPLPIVGASHPSPEQSVSIPLGPVPGEDDIELIPNRSESKIWMLRSTYNPGTDNEEEKLIAFDVDRGFKKIHEINLNQIASLVNKGDPNTRVIPSILQGSGPSERDKVYFEVHDSDWNLRVYTYNLSKGSLGEQIFSSKTGSYKREISAASEAALKSRHIIFEETESQEEKQGAESAPPMENTTITVKSMGTNRLVSSYKKNGHYSVIAQGEDPSGRYLSFLTKGSAFGIGKGELMIETLDTLTGKIIAKQDYSRVLKQIKAKALQDYKLTLPIRCQDERPRLKRNHTQGDGSHVLYPNPFQNSVSIGLDFTKEYHLENGTGAYGGAGFGIGPLERVLFSERPGVAVKATVRFLNLNGPITADVSAPREVEFVKDPEKEYGIKMQEPLSTESIPTGSYAVQVKIGNRTIVLKGMRAK